MFLCFRFNVILVSRSYAQLRATFQEYAKIANKDIDDTIQSEMSGDLKDSMLAIGRFLNPYFTGAILTLVTKPNTVKPVLSLHSKIFKTKILMTNGSLMKVKSNTVDIH